jgi:hypothetical protein
MKLYTEEQVNLAMRLMVEDRATFKQVLNQLTPIELPSDEEIDELLERKSSVNLLGFITGVKWMKEQILNQNK